MRTNTDISEDDFGGSDNRFDIAMNFRAFGASRKCLYLWYWFLCVRQACGDSSGALCRQFID